MQLWTFLTTLTRRETSTQKETWWVSAKSLPIQIEVMLRLLLDHFISKTWIQDLLKPKYLRWRVARLQSTIDLPLDPLKLRLTNCSTKVRNNISTGEKAKDLVDICLISMMTWTLLRVNSRGIALWWTAQNLVYKIGDFFQIKKLLRGKWLPIICPTLK